MPLFGYMKTSEPGRISSLGSVDGNNIRRRKLRPLTEDDKDTLILRVLDCFSHEPKGGVVPVMLRKSNGERWVDIGIAKCCPLCWRILVLPEGIDLPEPNLQMKEPARKRATKQPKTRRPVAREGAVAHGAGYRAVLQAIKPMMESRVAFSVADVVAATGLGRTVVRKYVMRLVTNKQLAMFESGGGRGKRTLYRKAP